MTTTPPTPLPNTSPSPAVLFAGGGTGGHIYPSLAVAERLDDLTSSSTSPVTSLFACSNRPIDSHILTEARRTFFPLPVRPLPRRPWHFPAFLSAYRASVAQSARLISQHNIRVVIAMGGFVCAPPVAAARRLRTPTILVNLDAHPGIANRYIARRCDRILAVHPDITIAGRPAELTPLPIRRSAIGPEDPRLARRQLNLNPDTPVLLITGASQGADSINNLFIALAARPDFRSALANWHILHLAGHDRAAQLTAAYRDASLSATVLEFCHTMGLAWRAAELAVSRGGANSVAEAAANRTPTLFLPYPFHRDLHQKLNVQPLADSGRAILAHDHVDPAANVTHLGPLLLDLITHPDRRLTLRRNLDSAPRADGASHIASLALQLAQLSPPPPSQTH